MCEEICTSHTRDIQRVQGKPCKLPRGQLASLEDRMKGFTFPSERLWMKYDKSGMGEGERIQISAITGLILLFLPEKKQQYFFSPSPLVSQPQADGSGYATGLQSISSGVGIQGES